MSEKRPDSPHPFQCRDSFWLSQCRSPEPAVIQATVNEGLTQGEPHSSSEKPGHAHSTNDGEPLYPEDKRFGLLRLITRLHGQVRARSKKYCHRCSVCAMAVNRFNRLASWVNALRFARKGKVDGLAAEETYYNALRSDEEWSTSLSPADPSVQISSRLQDQSL